jgi:YD repeat-containing protein
VLRLPVAFRGGVNARGVVMPIMLAMNRHSSFLAAVALVASSSTVALQRCELDGRPVDVNNGAATANRSGLVRCRDADSGQVEREQQLQDGRFMGVVRQFKAGQVAREYSVDEKGNRDGVSREWEIDATTSRRTLVREETLRNSQNVGVARAWYSSGTPRRLTAYGDDGRERAAVDFNEDGRVSALRCTGEPVFGPLFDDRTACGHAGAASTVVLYSGRGTPTSRITYDRGERRKAETLFPSGAVRQIRVTEVEGGFEQTFAENGVKRRELRWVTVVPGSSAGTGTSTNAPTSTSTSTGAGAGANAGGIANASAASSFAPRPRSVETLDQEFHESGSLVRERRWTPTERGAEPLLEATWYLNGQPRDRDEFVTEDGRRLRHQTTYYDDGRPASQGVWWIGPSGSRVDRSERAIGVHKRFYPDGTRTELTYDDRGRVARERDVAADGRTVRDDEVFEDGSRKATGR